MFVSCNFCGCSYDPAKGGCPNCGGHNSAFDDELRAESKRVKEEILEFEATEKKRKEEKFQKRQAELDVAEKKVKSGCVAIIATIVILILIGVGVNYLFG